jgi:hypothetical protein
MVANVQVRVTADAASYQLATTRPPPATAGGRLAAPRCTSGSPQVAPAQCHWRYPAAAGGPASRSSSPRPHRRAADCSPLRARAVCCRHGPVIDPAADGGQQSPGHVFEWTPDPRVGTPPRPSGHRAPE